MFILSIECDRRAMCARGSVPVWIRGNLHWVGYAVLSQSTHPCLSAANPVCASVCECACVCVYVCVYVCMCARYKWLAGQPLAMNITEHSQRKFKLTGGRFPQSTFSCLCVVGGGSVLCFFSTCFIFFFVYFALNFVVLGRQYSCLCFEMICSPCDELKCHTMKMKGWRHCIKVS